MRKNRVVQNASWMIGARVIQALLSFIIGMLTARFLGPSNYGLINYAASVVAFFTPIMELGITSIIVHQLIEYNDCEGDTLGTALVLNLFSAIFCIAGIIAFSMVTNYGEKETIVVCTLYSILLVFKAVEILQYWFQAHLYSKYSSFASLIAYLIVSGYKVFLLAAHKRVSWFAISYAIDNCVIAIILWCLYKKLGGQKLHFSKTTATRLFSQGKYYIVSSMMVTIFAQTDKIMLKAILGSESVGYYSAAVTCAGMTGFIISAVIDSFRPIIFEGKKKSEELFHEHLVSLYSVIIYFSLLQSIIMTIGARLIVTIIYGDQYLPSIAALRIVVWYTTFAYLGSIRNIWLLAENKQKYLWMINLFGALANVVLNALLIPYFGINGASFASLVTQLFTNVIVGYIIRPISPNNTLMVKGLNPKALKVVLGKVIGK